MFEDQFNDLTNWSDRLWYQNPSPNGAVSVSGSSLRLECRRRDGYPHIAATSVVADAMSGRWWTRGFIEARMRWTAGKGSWPAFWLFDLAHSQGGSNLVSEIDIFEGNGSLPSQISCVLHYNTSGLHGVPDQTRYLTSDIGIDLSDWHTYAVSWESDTVTWFLDGSVIFSCETFSTTGQPKYIVFSMHTFEPDATTPDVLVTEVDWVRVWKRKRNVIPSSVSLDSRSARDIAKSLNVKIVSRSKVRGKPKHW